MTRVPGRSAVAPAIIVSLIIRMFWGLTISRCDALNAIWLCPLIGLVLYLPFGFAIKRIGALGNGSPWEHLRGHAPKALMTVVALVFSLLLLHDGALTARLTADSTNIIALNEVTPQVLVLPMGIVALLIVWLGMEASGNSSRIWLRFYALLGAIIFFIQIRSCNLGWLSPILGTGASSILRGGVYCASCMCLLTLPWLFALPDRYSHGLERPLLTATAVATLLLMIQQTLAPALPYPTFGRAERIELILGNGRLFLSPQIILDLLWYGNLLYLLSAEVGAAGVFIQMSFPRIPTWLLGVACAGILSLAAATNHVSDPLTNSVFPLTGGLLAMLMLFSIPAKEVQIKCEDTK